MTEKRTADERRDGQTKAGSKKKDGGEAEDRSAAPDRPGKMTGMIAVVVVIVLVIASTAVYFYYSADEPDDDGGPDGGEKEVPVASTGGNREVLSLVTIKFDGGASYDPDGGEVSHHWSFGDGSFSTEASPSHTYNKPGTFLVTLTVKDDEGDTASDRAYIKVLNRLPSVSAKVSAELIVYQVAKYNGTGTDPDGIITRYEWDFNGDGKYEWYAKTTGVTSHFYTSAGKYTARFKITDDNGAANTTELEINVGPVPNSPPEADAGTDQKAGAGMITLFGTGTDPDDNIVKYEWDFDGDGTYDWESDESGIANHTYTDEGTYEAVFQVTDKFGLNDTDNVSITIDNSIISADIGAEVYIKWDSKKFPGPSPAAGNENYDYIVKFNNTVAIDNISVVIIDLPGGDMETVSGQGLSFQDDERTVLVNSKRISGPSRTKVEVLYLGYLVGTRDIDTTGDLLRRLLNPFYDQEEKYSYTTELHIEDEQTIRDEKHTGTLSVVQNNRLTRNSFSGSGTLKIVNELEGSRTIFNLTSDHVFRNATWQDGEQIQDSFEFAGSGRYKFTSVQGATFDITLDEFVWMEQNGDLTDYHFSGSGTYSYAPVEGISKLKYDLLGMDVHDNWEGKAFTCEKYRIETTIEYTINTTKFTFNNVSMIWVVADEQTYDERSIYVEFVYRYSENDLVKNQTMGKYYINEAPVAASSAGDIIKAMDIGGIAPVKALPGDSFTSYDAPDADKRFAFDYTGSYGSTELIDGDLYQTTLVTGEIVENGDGTVTMEIVNTGRYCGWVVSRSENYSWNKDRFKRDVALIT